MSLPCPIYPGDILLYGKSDLFGWITSIRTWSPAVHVEICRDTTTSYASRNGIGVNIYPIREAQLIAVLRPMTPDMAAIERWFQVPFDAELGTGVKGRPYGWLDLLRFYSKKLKTNGWICSEFAANACFIGGVLPFQNQYNSGFIDPGDFFISPKFLWQWVEPKTFAFLNT